MYFFIFFYFEINNFSELLNAHVFVIYILFFIFHSSETADSKIQRTIISHIVHYYNTHKEKSNKNKKKKSKATVTYCHLSSFPHSFSSYFFFFLPTLRQIFSQTIIPIIKNKYSEQKINNQSTLHNINSYTNNQQNKK